MGDGGGKQAMRIGICAYNVQLWVPFQRVGEQLSVDPGVVRNQYANPFRPRPWGVHKFLQRHMNKVRRLGPNQPSATIETSFPGNGGSPAGGGNKLVLSGGGEKSRLTEMKLYNVAEVLASARNEMESNVFVGVMQARGCRCLHRLREFALFQTKSRSFDLFARLGFGACF